MTSIIKVDTIQDTAGNNIINENSNTITIGASGDTITIPSGATIANSGTATGFGLSAGSEPIVKAWCKWTGTTIGDSYNVSSVTNPSTGQYVINFADNMDNANFSTVASIYGQNFGNAGFELEAQDTSSTTLRAKNFSSNTAYNMGSGGYGCTIIIGDNSSL